MTDELRVPWRACETDPRQHTELPTVPFLEAMKTWGQYAGKCRSENLDTIRVWHLECMLAALRVYEFERYKMQVEESRALAGS